MLIVPLWSSRVLPSDYGRWVLTLPLIEFLQGLISFGLISFGTKVLFRCSEEKANAYFGMVCRMLLGSTLVAAVALAFGSPWLTRWVVGSGAPPWLFAAMALYLVFSQINGLAAAYFQGTLFINKYVYMNTIRWIGNSGCLLFFVLWLKAGFLSWVAASVFSEALLLPISYSALKRLNWRWWNSKMAVFALRFSGPQVPTQIVGSLQARAGRYVLALVGPSKDVGFFGVAQNFSQNYHFFTRPCKAVAIRILGHKLERDPNEPLYLEFFHAFSLSAGLVALTVAFFLGDAMRLFLAKSYHPATVAVPWLVFALYLEEVFSLYDSLMFRYYRVWFQLLANGIGFAGLLIGLLCLAPIWGLLGVAISQLMGSCGKLIFGHIYSQRVTPRPFGFLKKMGVVFSGIALVFVGQHFGASLLSRIIAWAIWTSLVGLWVWKQRFVLFPTMALRLFERPWRRMA